MTKADKIINELEKNIFKLSDKITKYVIEEADNIIESKNNNLEQFIIAMGSYFFIDKYDDIVFNRLKCTKLIDYLIQQYDEAFHITGLGMRIRKDGKRCFSWTTQEKLNSEKWYTKEERLF